MINDDGSANTATYNKSCTHIVIDNEIKKVDDGILADVAPTILKLLNIPKPKLMTGKILI